MINKIKDCLLHPDEEKLKLLVKNSMNEGMSIGDIADLFSKSFSLIGDSFASGEIYLPVITNASFAVNGVISMIAEMMLNNSLNIKNKIVIGSIKDDFHDIAKNLVSIDLQSQGYNVSDLGVDVYPKIFKQAFKEIHDCKVIIISSNMDSGIDAVKEVITDIREANGGGNAKIIVCGIGVNAEFAEKNQVIYSKDIQTTSEIVNSIFNSD